MMKAGGEKLDQTRGDRAKTVGEDQGKSKYHGDDRLGAVMDMWGH